MKKKTKYQTYIVLSKEGWELPFFYLKREQMRTKNMRMNLYLTFYFFLKNKKQKKS